MAVSSRAPDGRLRIIDDRVLRILNKSGEANLNTFLASAVAKKVVADGKFVRTCITDAESIKLLYEYARRERGRTELPEVIFSMSALHYSLPAAGRRASLDFMY